MSRRYNPVSRLPSGGFLNRLRWMFPGRSGLADPALFNATGNGSDSVRRRAATAARATTPLIKDRRDRLHPVDWDMAIKTFVGRMREVQSRFGQHAAAFLTSGRIANEELALLGALAKFGLGMLHGGSRATEKAANSAAAYREAFGCDAPPFSLADLEEADLLVFVGAEVCDAHPVVWQRVARNPHRPELIVIDSRPSQAASPALSHIALRPDSLPALFHGIAHILIAEHWTDGPFIEAHTNGFAEFAEFVGRYTPNRVAAATGIGEPALRELAGKIHAGRRVSSWWTADAGRGWSDAGAASRETARSLINLALLTGNIGRPGTGANALGSQGNELGARLFGNTTALLGGRDFADVAQRRAVARHLAIDPARIPDRNGWNYPEIIDGVLAGRIKALWIVAADPAPSWINDERLLEVFDRLEFLVVQDVCASTETALRADLVLPAAAWGEKEGTAINAERRIGLVKKVARPPGFALSDFSIFRLIAKYWGCGEMFAGWETPEAAFQILKRLSAGQPCDFSGIPDYRTLEERDGVQWPCPAGESDCQSERRLFADGRFYHDDGRARFVVEPEHAAIADDRLLAHV